MSYAGIQMFMEKLNQLIHCKDIRFFVRNTIIRSERPQFQLLYDELGSIIEALSIHQHLEKVNDLKKRFIDAAEEAEYIVDLFLSPALPWKFEEAWYLSSAHIRGAHIRNTFNEFSSSLNLDDVWRSFKSIQEEFMSMRIDSMKMNSSARTDNQYAPANTPITRISPGSNDEIVVGFGCEAELIIEKLVADYPKKLDVVSIVGMGGIGKTTLATKVFGHDYAKYHFHVRVWVSVSQTYDKRAVLTQILKSIGVKPDFEKAGEFYEKYSDSQLHELVHKNLMGSRYLIVIDDIWHIETWASLKLFFPHENKGSRILLTSRVTEVAKHASSNGLIHHMGYLNKETSWELLCQKVFHGNEYPEWSIKPGMEIVENCQGLPLALVVIAGVLAKENWSENFWVEIAERTGLYIVNEENGCLETLGLSYDHLPLHLRECFLYLGGFPEDYKIKVEWLIWLWVAEGFIQEDGNRSLEDIAEGYLMDLINRNLVIVAYRKSDGAVKGCKVHDLVRELCLKKAKEEQFILQTESSQFSNAITPPYKQVRMFINKDTYDPDFIRLPTQDLRSLLCFGNFRSLRDDISNNLCSFRLLRVLDLQKCGLNGFPRFHELLIHLRYLAIWILNENFPYSICDLWNLQTLIYITDCETTVLPYKISDLINLRHLRSQKGRLHFRQHMKPMNLQTISNVKLNDDFPKCFPYIKALRCNTFFDKCDFKSLTYLEKLKLTFHRRVESTAHNSPKGEPKNYITFPATLKALALLGCGLPWSDMSIIQSLLNLQVLKLHFQAFEGSCWNTAEQEFPQLRFLRLEGLNIKVWEAYSTSFPCLKQLEIFRCSGLEEIPLEIGDIPTLELIKIKECRHSVDESIRRIQEEQRDIGNYDLKIDVIPFEDINL
ncbi:putative late blight resistance protein homolog R1B-16 [Bidens hawaiensis]|uniref:putative late blight resistance protein homolog R1B-16 n=1 Tax=Bidens hawaiensis TaxID=980011 RepID=UPI0040496373